MYLHFEDWSWPLFLDVLDKKGLPHSGTIIKVFATKDNPRQIFNRPGLAVLKSNEAAFSEDEEYHYGQRGSYLGPELEKELAGYGLNEEGACAVRSLFRFSNRHGFCQAAMEKTGETGWLIDHPFEDIDGIEIASQNPARTFGIHLDIFFPESVTKLREIIDFDYEGSIVDAEAATQSRRKSA